MSVEEQEQLVLSQKDLKSELVTSDKLDSAIASISPPVPPEKAQEIKSAVVDAASQAVRSSGTSLDSAMQRDPWLLRIVLGVLSATLLTCIGAGIFAQFRNLQPSSALLTWGTGALTALTALVSPSGRY